MPYVREDIAGPRAGDGAPGAHARRRGRPAARRAGDAGRGAAAPRAGAAARRRDPGVRPGVSHLSLRSPAQVPPHGDRARDPRGGRGRRGAHLRIPDRPRPDGGRAGRLPGRRVHARRIPAARILPRAAVADRFRARRRPAAVRAAARVGVDLLRRRRRPRPDPRRRRSVHGHRPRPAAALQQAPGSGRPGAFPAAGAQAVRRSHPAAPRGRRGVRRGPGLVLGAVAGARADRQLPAGDGAGHAGRRRRIARDAGDPARGRGDPRAGRGEGDGPGRRRADADLGRRPAGAPVRRRSAGGAVAGRGRSAPPAGRDGGRTAERCRRRAHGQPHAAALAAAVRGRGHAVQHLADVAELRRRRARQAAIRPASPRRVRRVSQRDQSVRSGRQRRPQLRPAGRSQHADQPVDGRRVGRAPESRRSATDLGETPQSGWRASGRIALRARHARLRVRSLARGRLSAPPSVTR